MALPKIFNDIENKVNRSGDTMKGRFTLKEDPLQDLEASTKRYVDESIINNSLIDTESSSVINGDTRWMTYKNEDGIKEKFYPVTHVDAIVDFDEKIQEIAGNSSKNAVVHNDLSEVDLNTITHACCGYAYLCTNKPTGNNGYFECVPIEGGSICLQRYTPYGDITYYRQLYTDGTWSEWSTQFLPLIGGTLTDDLTIEKSSSVSHTLKNTATGRQSRITATGDNYFSMYNEKIADPNNNKVAIWLGNENIALENVLRINHVLDGVSNTYKIFGQHNTVPVANGGTGKTSFTAGMALVGNGSSIAERTITNNTSAATASGTNLATCNTVAQHSAAVLNRSNGVHNANTSYTTYMARGIALVTAAPSSLTNGCCAFVYQ